MAELMQKDDELDTLNGVKWKMLPIAEKSRLVFAYYVTGHGLGHATRVIEVARELIRAGHEVHIVTGAPEYVFLREINNPNLHVRQELLDCGAVQSDALTVDPVASLELYWQTAMLSRRALLEAEASWLRLIGAHLVVSDVVPIACAAASQAGIPSVCVSNFSWDFIYSEYVAGSKKQYRGIVWQIAEDYSKALFLIRLPGFCPTPAFRDVIDVPLVVRPRRKSRAEVRKELGIDEDTRLLVLSFGGQDSSWSLKAEFLPPRWKCVVCGTSRAEVLPPNFIQPDRDAYTPDLIAASNCVLGKIGYGTVSEVLAYKVPLVFVRRDQFNEEPFLRKMLEHFRCGVEMNRRDFFSGRWTAYLERACAIKPNYDGCLNGGQVVAQILEDAVIGKVDGAKKQSGVGRLRDAIVFGYHMRRAPDRADVRPPGDWWYTGSHFTGQWSPQDAGDVSPDESPRNTLTGHDPKTRHGTAGFEILHGSTHDLEDTVAFLHILSRLDEDGDIRASDNADKPQPQERLAACQLFRWEDTVFIARAPGRLDVMGGIADYSGSMVLQLPIKEACHVAVQRQPLENQRLWKHTEARHKSLGLRSALRIVSFGAEKSNRSPTFDMDLSDFIGEDGEPISYAAGRKYFEHDPSQKWAAYVAGVFLVLMKEMGAQFEDGVNILVVSDVPEGKGVSSSAAIEVATMTAVAAAHGLHIPPRKLALLCQMVENQVVGAPCGVMDQMATACGERGKLLAMICQPAEVLDHVKIPSHVRFWGIDSGIRHSIGGTDYGTVRIGAFMGRRIIREAAHRRALSLDVERQPVVESASESLKLDNCGHFNMTTTKVHAHEKFEDDFQSFDQSTAVDKDVAYLCQVPPHRFDAVYSAVLPAEIKGKTFISTYGNHDDPVTLIDPMARYPVRASTAHPIYENFRVQTFSQLLTTCSSAGQLSTLGELMFQSHCSYSLCGLGSDGTDKLVVMVDAMKKREKSDPEGNPSLFGAKITGGGSGGTVCVIGSASIRAEEDIREVQRRYSMATGYTPYIFEGSSPGAAQFGHLEIRRQPVFSI